ncbi:hypothetical protein SEUCBS140593_004916 [Sporothrix eucalyptigena]|uniref:Uncharacterized protein n=1 Tax=Sporothrix eucalyptigena TaxID=1812306 RepID=A0ABP0BS35_9PEZI
MDEFTYIPSAKLPRTQLTRLDEFTYIPPAEWARMQRAGAPTPKSATVPTFPSLNAELVSVNDEAVSIPQHKTTKAKATTPKKATRKMANKATTATSAPSPPPAVDSLLKRRATQNHKRTNTKKIITNKKWIPLGDGFRYAPGPTIPRPLRHWAWRDTAEYTAGEMVRCAVLGILLFLLYVLLFTVWTW